MSELPHAQFVRAEDRYGNYRAEDYAQYDGEETLSAGVGWIAFAAVIMTLKGGLYLVAGLVTLVESHVYGVKTNALTVNPSWTTLGWFQLIFGLLVAAAGISLIRGYLWARAVVVVLAAVGIVENFLDLGAAPIWNMIQIALGIVVIYAVIVHGREAAALSR